MSIIVETSDVINTIRQQFEMKSGAHFLAVFWDKRLQANLHRLALLPSGQAPSPGLVRQRFIDSQEKLGNTWKLVCGLSFFQYGFREFAATRLRLLAGLTQEEMLQSLAKDPPDAIPDQYGVVSMPKDMAATPV